MNISGDFSVRLKYFFRMRKISFIYFYLFILFIYIYFYHTILIVNFKTHISFFIFIILVQY